MTNLTKTTDRPLDRPAPPSAEAEVVAHLRAVAATPPGEQSLWDCTIAAWAADLIASHQSALAQSAAENREIAMQGLAAEGQAQEAYEKLTAARAEIERLKKELKLVAGQLRYATKSNAKNWDDLKAAEARAEAAADIARHYGSECNMLQNDNVDREDNIIRRDAAYTIEARILTFLSTLPASTAPTAPVTATHRHKKRGTEYVLIGIGKMQAEDWFDRDGGWTTTSVDMREVAIYHSVTEPTEIWVRPREEFEDGRFETLKAAITEVNHG